MTLIASVLKTGPRRSGGYRLVPRSALAEVFHERPGPLLSSSSRPTDWQISERRRVPSAMLLFLLAHGVLDSPRAGGFPMAVQVILNQHKGPFPITVSFKAPSDGPSCLVVSGSVWSQTANQTIGIEVSLDNKPIGSASIYSNGTATHRAVVPTYIPLTLKFGEHELFLGPATPVTISDSNDFFDVVLLY